MRAFAITWDYRCPFARNANEHVLDGLAAGAAWHVTFVPFSLGQVHVAEGEPPVWDRPDSDSGLLALQVGTAVRDLQPERFGGVHRDLFALRHDEGRSLQDHRLLHDLLDRHGVDVDAIIAMVEDGRALKMVRDAHEDAVASHGVFGVPTFIAAGQAVFVRLMDRPPDASTTPVQTVEHILDLMEHRVDLNEFKHTTIPR